ncbi:hypothetical protein Q5P01_007727 [Channa striata]|uniref:Uncharacterized protein n=1 Tax=Channa striata TaxID=64152 RepID=A0AA88N8W1_CHASR|nr:hypothetical protein Q5P01_007727 [Channa striata]
MQLKLLQAKQEETRAAIEEEKEENKKAVCEQTSLSPSVRTDALTPVGGDFLRPSPPFTYRLQEFYLLRIFDAEATWMLSLGLR